MADQDTSKSTPAPYKGAKGRLQQAGLAVQGASGAGGGSGNPEGLKPFMEGIQQGQEAQKDLAETQTQLRGLRNQQQRDSDALRTDVSNAQRELADTPTATDVIKTAITGAMLLEAGANAIASSSAVETTTPTIVTDSDGNPIPKLGADGNPMFDEAGEPIYTTYDRKSTTEKAGVARGVSDVIGFMIPGVGRMREGQRENAEATLNVQNQMAEMASIGEFRHAEQMQFTAALADATKTYRDAAMGAFENDEEAYLAMEREIREKTGIEVEALAKLTGRYLAKDLSEHMRTWDPVQIGPPAPQGLLNQQLHPLINIIAGAESSGSFRAMNQGGNETTGVIGSTTDSSSVIGRDITEMTIDELRAAGQHPMHNPGRVFVAGRLQWGIKNGAFEEAVRAAGLKGDDVFSPENQQKMESAYFMSLPSVKKYIAGNGSIDEIHKELTRVWAALKKDDGTGEYDGNMNTATVDSTAIKAVLNQIMPGLIPKP